MNPYEVLGVAPDVSDDEIRSAYRRLVRELHPDPRARDIDGPAADEALRRVQAAWRTLLSPGVADTDASGDDALGGAEPRHHGARRFPWWVVAIAVMVVIFIVTAYAGSVPVSPPAGP